MSYHSTQPVAPMRHRSSSAVRNKGNSYTNSRPRSLGFFGSNSTYSSPYSTPSSTPSFTSFSNYNNNNNPLTSSYKSPYFQNTYRNSSNGNGYASLSIPTSLSSNLYNGSNNYLNKTNDNNNNNSSTSGHRSRRDLTRHGSFNNRDRSMSRSRNPSVLSSGLSSKSISLTSLASEGYISGSERSSRSRLGSTQDIRNENGEIDYKKLYEQALVENDRLKDKLRKADEELRETKQTLEKINVVTSKNSLSELEKRERRAMERKLSEMEEELKQLQKLKAENERLKADNRSLTRVISKLTNSPKK